MPRRNQFIRTDDQTPRIISIEFHRHPDNDPDLSYLGEYQSQPGEEAKTVFRETAGWREHKYFVAAMGPEDTGNPDSVAQDYARMEAYNEGQWYMCFFQAVATISINGVMQKITSGGLGGVESDSDKSYFKKIRDEEFGQLKELLADIGFAEADVAKAIAEATDD